MKARLDQLGYPSPRWLERGVISLICRKPEDIQSTNIIGIEKNILTNFT